MSDSLLTHTMSNAEAEVRMIALRDEWMAFNFAEYEKSHVVVERALKSGASELKSHELRWLSDAVLKDEIARGNLKAQDSWHDEMLKTNFMRWIRKYHRDEWRVVALWLDEEVRTEDPEYYAEEFENGDPGKWFWNKGGLIDCILK